MHFRFRGNDVAVEKKNSVGPYTVGQQKYG